MCVALKAVLHFTENLDLYPIEDAPPNAYSVAVPVTEDRRFHEPADVGGSTVNGHVMIIDTETSIPHLILKICSFDI